MAQKITTTSPENSDRESFPLALVSLPSTTSQRIITPLTSTQLPVLESSHSIQLPIAEPLPSIVASPRSIDSPNSADSVPGFSVVPTQRMTTRAMRGITKKKKIFDLVATIAVEPTTLKQALKDSN